jgi:hypothetical protein
MQLLSRCTAAEKHLVIVSQKMSAVNEKAQAFS